MEMAVHLYLKTLVIQLVKFLKSKLKIDRNKLGLRCAKLNFVRFSLVMDDLSSLYCVRNRQYIPANI
jgi:hypothetical protein